MTRLSPTTAKKLIKFLKIHGYCEERQSGSHLTLRNDTEHKSITIPVHPSRKIGKGLLKHILNEAGFTVEEFNKEVLSNRWLPCSAFLLYVESTLFTMLAFTSLM